MDHALFSISCVALTAVVVATAVTTDLLWRRIPNLLTIPAFALGCVVRVFFQGWAGLGLALAGALLGPFLLWLMHGGKGIGMGDLKLMAAVGAILGPVMAVVSVLLSAVAGGLLSIAVALKPGGQLRQLINVFLIGLPFWKKRTEQNAVAERDPSSETIPYGLAIGVGSLMTLAVYWWTGNENWFLSFVGIAGSP